jgi:hypothetical protein
MSCRRLFLDLHDVTRMEGLHRRLHTPHRHAANPILQGKNPWERFASLYGTVLRDPQDGLFKMWYLTGPQSDNKVLIRGREALGNCTLLAYAVSRDGVHWIKPELNQVDFAGSTANNLVDVGRSNCEGFAVLYDERDKDPERRFKSFYWEHGGVDTFVEHEGRLIWGEGEGDGMWVSFSPDGVHWKNCDSNPVIAKGSDTTQSLVWDERLGKYVAFGRMGAGGRKIARATSDDGVHFGEPELVFAPDELDEEGTQFYGMPLHIYEGIYIGMVWVYREGVDGCIDTSLATSRDGVHWQRVLDRQTFLGLGPRGSWEDGMVRVSQNFVLVDDEIYLYYGGVQGAHTGRKFKQVERTQQPALGLATLRRDGFVSLEAREEEGQLLTKPLVIDGNELHVNAASKGHLVAEITDDVGLPLPGYTSLPMVKDRTDALLRFDRPLAALRGHKVRLRFRLKRADLFSYWFAG